MLSLKKIILLALSTTLITLTIAQHGHPATKQIDSLKKLLPSTSGIQRINCLNALSEAYWWPPHVLPDSITYWAKPAYDEAVKAHYSFGIATANMHLGVGEIYRKNYLKANKYLSNALQSFDSIHNEHEYGWCKLWLGQVLYAENNFADAIVSLKISRFVLAKYHDGEGEGKAAAWLSLLYEATGGYDSSFNYCRMCLHIRQGMHDDVCVAGSLMIMGHLYKNAGAYNDALDYYHQSQHYADAHGFNVYTSNWNNIHEAIGTIYRLLNKPDSSLYYLNEALKIDPESQVTWISLGETLLLKQQYDSALSIFLKPEDHFRKENDQWDLMRILLDAAKAYDKKNEETEALLYARNGFSIAQQTNMKPFMIQGYQLLAEINRKLHNDDSALFFMQKFIALKDSVSNQQFLWRLTNYKKQTDFIKEIDQVSSLQKDNKIKQEQLKNATMLKWFFIIGLLIVALLSIVLYRSLALKRKNEKLQSENEQSILKQTASELEMRALKAQMNPHFIFNCLSSINRFILKNETEAASDYLTKFSRLIRMVLTNSNKTFITLEDELDTLKLYLDMERLRFKNSFDYSISFKNSIDAGNIFIPPLLLQPFAENAIWHGLMHKQDHGHLEILLSMNNKILTCAITDNGVGRNNAAVIKEQSTEKQKSMGLKITSDRLALLNNNINTQTSFSFEDLTNSEGKPAGTKVILNIDCRSLAEASA